MKYTAKYGSWTSSISAENIGSGSVRRLEPKQHHQAVYWLESRPAEKGRVALVCYKHGKTTDILDSPWSVRSRVHEYGGGSYLVCDAGIFFVNAADQNIYWMTEQHAEPIPLTASDNQRYADLHFIPSNNLLIAVAEEHGTDIKNFLVSIQVDTTKLKNKTTQPEANPTVFHSGFDFYSNPSSSPDGQWLSWLSWNHPHMPWDATQIWLARLDDDNTSLDARCIAGQANDQSLFQPQWAPNGQLFWVSDTSNWWNIVYADISHGEMSTPTTLYAMDAEFATPQWVFGMSTFGFLDRTTVFATFTQNGQWQLCYVDLSSGQLSVIETELSDFSAIHCCDGKAVFVGASHRTSASIYHYSHYDSQNIKALSADTVNVDPKELSIPVSFEFATTHHETAHGFYYPPRNSEFQGPENDRPPVIVLAHGGPTGACSSQLNLKTQFWAHRGFAILDINYRGSTGYGRQFRDSLKGYWGTKDVDDLCEAANFAIKQGWINAEQKIIKGSSAGGYSVLAALAFRDCFDLGVSIYGIGDLELLVNDTHKFETHYLDSLVGAYPEKKQTYRDRSPIHSTDKISAPILVQQGSEDKVVPPSQAEAFVEAAKQKQLPVAYSLYPNEGHGFRDAKTIIHALTSELYFYRRIFGIKNGEDETEITIYNAH